MATAYRVDAPLVLATGKDGQIHHYYSADSSAGPSIIEWLSDEQAAHFLAEGLVTPIEVQDEAETAALDMTERVTQCIQALSSLGLPADCGAPAAREALRESGAKFGNEIIAAAIKARKAALSGLSGTAPG